jgi:hypothetical protein
MLYTTTACRLQDEPHRRLTLRAHILMVRLNTTLSSTTHQEKTRPSTPWLQPRCEQRPDWQLCCEFLQAAWDEIGVKFTFKVVANAVLEEDQTAGYAPALLSDV